MAFWRYLTRRIVHTAVTLLLLLIFMFTLFRLIPGDPTTLMLGSDELSQEAQQHLRAMWGLDQPQWRQFINYVVNLMQGNLGLSFYYRRPVLEVVQPMLENTLLLMTPVVVLAISIGITAGTWLGWRRGGRAEEIGALLVLIPRALPVFWIGIIFLALFAYQLRWFPIAGMRESFFFPTMRGRRCRATMSRAISCCLSSPACW
jgi:peptide/nickel transport system permease protein